MERKKGKSALSQLAAFLEGQQEVVTNQWMLAIRRDPEMSTSGGMTHLQLLDYLPLLYRELCAFLRQRDPAALQTEVKQDARQHGEHRWRQGYRLDELLRELEILRRILLATVVTSYAHAHPEFRDTAEITARSLINEFFSIATITSVKQFMGEHENEIKAYTDKLEEANQRLIKANGSMEESAAAELRLSYIISHELSNFLRSFATTVQLLQQEPPSSKNAVIANAQIRDMNTLLLQLIDYSNLAGRRLPVVVERFELAPLHEELVQLYRPQAEVKGLVLKGQLDAAPQSVVSDRVKIKQIAAKLLSNALKYTIDGEVVLSFSGRDGERWALSVSDTGDGIAAQDYQRLFNPFDRRSADETLPDSGIGLAVVKELVSLLEGSINVVSKLGHGTQFEIILPRWNKPTQETKT
jgi:signal transduction histidine kinase